MEEDRKPEHIGEVLQGLLSRALDAAGRAEPLDEPPTPPADAARPAGRYDFALAESPPSPFHKPRLSRAGREPLTYTDTIRGKNGEPVTRVWKAYPGPFGVGGASTQALLFDLLQLYAEQGGCG